MPRGYPDTVTCPECKEGMPADFSYCPDCGGDLHPRKKICSGSRQRHYWGRYGKRFDKCFYCGEPNPN